jgi:hypothetical protein
VNLKFSPPIRWKAKNENIVTSQIDHVVVGPSGLFLIETKNWKPEDIENKIEELNYQISRSGLALWYHLSKYRWTDQEPKIRKILVSIQGYKSKPELDNFIHPLSPNQLCGYITTRGTFLSEHTINNLVATIPWSESK